MQDEHGARDQGAVRGTRRRCGTSCSAVKNGPDDGAYTPSPDVNLKGGDPAEWPPGLWIGGGREVEVHAEIDGLLLMSYYNFEKCLRPFHRPGAGHVPVGQRGVRRHRRRAQQLDQDGGLRARRGLPCAPRPRVLDRAVERRAVRVEEPFVCEQALDNSTWRGGFVAQSPSPPPAATVAAGRDAAGRAVAADLPPPDSPPDFGAAAARAAAAVAAAADVAGAVDDLRRRRRRRRRRPASTGYDATNYDAAAVVDDGSCTFPITWITWPVAPPPSPSTPPTPPPCRAAVDAAVAVGTRRRRRPSRAVHLPACGQRRRRGGGL